MNVEKGEKIKVNLEGVERYGGVGWITCILWARGKVRHFQGWCLGKVWGKQKWHSHLGFCSTLDFSCFWRMYISFIYISSDGVN